MLERSLVPIVTIVVVAITVLLVVFFRLPAQTTPATGAPTANTQPR